MSGTHRMLRQDCEVLLRQIDGRLATLRSGRATPRADPDTDLDVAERTADALRHLVAETARASAADLARVRAAVHYFVARGRTRTPSWRYGTSLAGIAGRRNEPRPGPSIGDDVRVVGEILRDLCRDD